MAKTTFGTNHPLAVKLYSKRLMVEALKSTWIGKLIGTDTNSLIYRKDETSKGAGDKITYGLRTQLTGRGVEGDGTLEGFEEALSVYTDSITINQLRHAIRSAGKMSEQRVPFDVREEALSGLKDWWAGRIDLWAANQLAGNSAQTDTNYTGLQAVTAPDAAHLFCGGGEALETSLCASVTHILKLSDIDKAVAKAKATYGVQPDGTTDGGNPIRPVMIEGGEYYCLFMHPYQVYQLRKDTNTLQWADVQKAAMSGGKITDNPIFTGALGMYNGVVLHEWSRLPNIVGTPSSGAVANFRRAVFAGAQSACIAFGQGNSEQPNWYEELFDYGNQLGVAGGLIGGLKKTIYNSQDFGTIVISTYAPAP